MFTDLVALELVSFQQSTVKSHAEEHQLGESRLVIVTEVLHSKKKKKNTIKDLLHYRHHTRV